MKTCTQCLITQSDTEFSKKKIKDDGTIIRNTFCKACIRRVSREHYQKNREKYFAKNLQNREKLREKLFEYLRGKSCIDCGESDPIVLEFDHVRGKKKGIINDVLIRTTRWERVLEEIAKCEIRCANCHRRKTVRELNHQRGRYFGI